MSEYKSLPENIEFHYPPDAEDEKQKNRSDQPLDVIPEGGFQAELSDSQKAAIKHTVEIAQTIQSQFPEIADDYRAGLTLNGLTDKYRIKDKYGVGDSIANNAIAMALRGYDGKWQQFSDVRPFDGLIKEESEFTTVARQHIIAGVEGQIRDRVGIHAQTYEDHQEIGRLGVIAQGSRPYTNEEKSLVQDLALKPEYQRRSRINSQKIAAEINKVLYGGEEIRNSRQIQKIIGQMKKK